MERSKESDLSLVARILDDTGTPYAIIGGVALQVHQEEPRTTLDVDVAVLDRGSLPRASLLAAGFRETGRHQHTENWIGPGGTPVPFTDDPALTGPLSRAGEVPVGEVRLRVLRRSDLLHEKLRAGRDPARHRSKRLQDLVDAQALLEQDPTLERELTSDEKALLEGLPR
jgi:predicted nucleotidyltransferase